jgi:hypothetical protein
MKLNITLSYSILFVVGILISNTVLAGQTETSEIVVGVRQFMKNPDKYSGKISVQGVVSRVFHQEKLVVLIDIEELRECKVVTCARLTLPVRWAGPMPEVKSIIKVNGILGKEGNRLVLLAKSIEKSNRSQHGQNKSKRNQLP